MLSDIVGDYRRVISGAGSHNLRLIACARSSSIRFCAMLCASALPQFPTPSVAFTQKARRAGVRCRAVERAKNDLLAEKTREQSASGVVEKLRRGSNRGLGLGITRLGHHVRDQGVATTAIVPGLLSAGFRNIHHKWLHLLPLVANHDIAVISQDLDVGRGGGNRQHSGLKPPPCGAAVNCERPQSPLFVVATVNQYPLAYQFVVCVPHSEPLAPSVYVGLII
jgi:hypothetical protein